MQLFTMTPRAEGKWYKSRARSAVLSHLLVQFAFSLQDTLLKLLSTGSELWRVTVAEELLGWFVSHVRQYRLRHKPPHAHTVVYCSVPTAWSLLEGSLLQSLSIGSYPATPLSLVPFFSAFTPFSARWLLLLFDALSLKTLLFSSISAQPQQNFFLTHLPFLTQSEVTDISSRLRHSPYDI